MFLVAYVCLLAILLKKVKSGLRENVIEESLES